MKRLLALLVASALGCTPSGPKPFSLGSADIAPGSEIPRRFEFDGFGCKGNNRSPELHWLHAPSQAKSFAITVFDRDAPSGSGWWHWIVVNIPARTSSLTAGAGESSGGRLPAGARQFRNDFGSLGWGGVCPPARARGHRYLFTVYALSVETLEVPQDASAALVSSTIKAHAIAKAQFVATYSR